MVTDNTPSAGWVPAFTLDLGKATGQGFGELVEEFNASTKAMGELKPLKLKNGWYTVTPEMAETLLRYNRPGANRKLALVTVIYYATQMKAGQWPRTGQGLVFDEEGWLQDGQHRLWAAYLGQVSFDTYIVADVPHIANLFAYLDNSRVRSASVALQTAGLNGLSPLISQIVQIAHNYEIGVYTCQSKRQHVVRMAPIQYLAYVEAHPEVRKAAHLTASEYKEACEAANNDRGTIGFIVYKIITSYDEDTCDRFMEQITLAHDGFTQDETLKALNTYLFKNPKSKSPDAKHVVMAHIIKAFNAWISHISLKKITVPGNEDFPRFLERPQEFELVQDE